MAIVISTKTLVLNVTNVLTNCRFYSVKCTVISARYVGKLLLIDKFEKHLWTHQEVKSKELVAIAQNIGSKLSCGYRENMKSIDSGDIIEPHIDVGSYDDIAEDSEDDSNEPSSHKVVTKFRGFLIEQLLGKQ